MASDWAEYTKRVIHLVLKDHGCDTAIAKVVDEAVALIEQHHADQLRIPADCVRLADGRVVRISAVGMEVLQNIADGKMAPAWPGTSSIMSAAEAARGGGST